MAEYDHEREQGIARLAMAVDKWKERAKDAEAFIARLADQAAAKPKEIVSTGRLSAEEIDAARSDGRLFVLENGLGFVLRAVPDHPQNFMFWHWRCCQEGCQALKLSPTSTTG